MVKKIVFDYEKFKELIYDFVSEKYIYFDGKDILQYGDIIIKGEIMDD